MPSSLLHGTRCRLVALIAILLSLALEAQAQNGPYKYCCGIQKCQNVTSACSQIAECASTCLGLDAVVVNDFSSGTKPYLPIYNTECIPGSTLADKDYSCFAQYLSSNTTLVGRICGQKYESGLPPAPAAIITYGQCKETCSGWDLATSSTSTGPVALLMQYIVPVVVFCWTIPRRRSWDVPDAMFDTSHLRYWFLKPPMLVAALFLSILIVIIDMGLWIFTTFLAAGPILVGGIIELVLDYRILQHMEDINLNTDITMSPGNPYRRLSTNERIELMVTVLCGNLDDTIGNPKDVICDVLYVRDTDDDVAASKQLNATQAHLASILRSQGTFGGCVGAPVLFFVGSFVVALDGLSESIGDNSAAHSLAFGMWWMVILQVTIVSSCILGSNNPSTISGIVGDYRHKHKKTENTHVLGLELGEARYLGMTPMYDSAFMPVTLWDRGRIKRRWLEHTSVWQAKSWLRRRIELNSTMRLVLVPMAAFLLVLAPTALAFLVSYTTPKICISCRSITFLIYITSQVVLVIANTWRAFSDAKVSFWEKHARLATNIATAVSAVLVGLAMSGSLITAFVGTTLELLGVYGNCACSIPAGMWFSPGRDAIQINLATDTQLHRDMSVFWSSSGYMAIGFIMSMTYLGWWYQRVLRHRFEGEISRLGEGMPPRTHSFPFMASSSTLGSFHSTFIP